MKRLAFVLLGLAACRRETPAPAVSQATLESAVVVTPFSSGPAASASHPGTLRVLVGGDLIPHRPALVEPAALERALAPLHPLFAGADAVVANYESATGEVEKKAFRLSYAAPPAWLGTLPGAGIGAVSVANNHACDLGHDGVGATLEAAKDAGVTALGGDAKGDAWAPRTLVERDGKRVCAVAWTTLVNAEGGCARTTRLAIATEGAAGRHKVTAALQRARNECDATVAIVHGGEEYAAQTPGILAMARQAAEAGADAVVIHHPHVASPVTVHATRDGRSIPIFASVGNLVSNQGESWKAPMFPVLRENRRLVCVNAWTRLGVVADLSFALDGAAPRLDWGYHLVWTENEHADDRAKATPAITTRLVDPDGDHALLAKLREDERGPSALFDDTCWRERGHDDATRCTTSLLRTKETPKHVRRSRR